METKFDFSRGPTETSGDLYGMYDRAIGVARAIDDPAVLQKHIEQTAAQWLISPESVRASMADTKTYRQTVNPYLAALKCEVGRKVDQVHWYESEKAAEKALIAAGYSVGPMQLGSPRGIKKGKSGMQKWRTTDDVSHFDGALVGLFLFIGTTHENEVCAVVMFEEKNSTRAPKFTTNSRPHSR